MYYLSMRDGTMHGDEQAGRDRLGPEKDAPLSQPIHMYTVQLQQRAQCQIDRCGGA